MLEVSCHCGEVTLSAQRLPESITDCNCSICRRLAALWAYYAADEVEIHSAPDVDQTYAWGDKQLVFHACSNCGCTTHYTSARKEPGRVAINMRMAEISVVEQIPVRYFDGAERWQYLPGR